MQIITINLIEQKILYDVLIESIDNINFEIKSYNQLSDFKKYFNSKKSHIIVADLNSKDLFLKNNINFPTLYLDFKKKDTPSLEKISCPFRLKEFFEKINIIFLKKNFSINSQYIVSNYKINLNSKEIFKNGIRLKLTEREINFILFLKKSNSPQSINSILKSVWHYSPNLETHTVETHVHRLRKKFFDSFKDEDFIKIKKEGYYI